MPEVPHPCLWSIRGLFVREEEAEEEVGAYLGPLEEEEGKGGPFEEGGTLPLHREEVKGPKDHEERQVDQDHGVEDLLPAVFKIFQMLPPDKCE